MRGNAFKQTGQSLRPESVVRPDHAGDQKDSGRSRRVPEDGEGKFVVVGPAVIEGNRARLRRQRLIPGPALQPVRELDSFKIPPEGCDDT